MFSLVSSLSASSKALIGTLKHKAVALYITIKRSYTSFFLHLSSSCVYINLGVCVCVTCPY